MGGDGRRSSSNSNNANSKLRTTIKRICSCACGDHSTVESYFFCHRVVENNERVEEGGMAPTGVQLHYQDRHVMVDNGIIQLTLSNPEGIMTGISYYGMDNVLEVANEENNRGYWDIVWNSLDGSSRSGEFEVIKTTVFKVITETDEQVELSFSRPWDLAVPSKLVPLNIEKRFVVIRGSSGFYTYMVYEHPGSPDCPGLSIGETRVAFKFRKDKFHYMVVADNRQRYMPRPEDRRPGRSQMLAYPEAVILVNPMEPELKGEVDDKYQYSCDNKDQKVHGWISRDSSPAVGVWMIVPSMEGHAGGPFKQNLTSHVGPATLAVFISAHYTGDDLVPKFEQGEPWKKVLGPVFIYLNSAMEGEDPLTLWDDAKRQMEVEVQSWPYCFPASEDFPSADQRGNVKGRMLVSDSFASSDLIIAKGAYVGLAPRGEAGSWQRESKDYQFWSRADEEGNFSIDFARAGIYNLYAYVPGFIGDYRYDADITITPGCEIEIGDVVYTPLRDGPTIWEIGVPDRTAFEFYAPDPDPKYVNKLYVNHPDRFRQYGLWDRYSELYPTDDLVYTVGKSDYTKDWFYAHVTRRTSDGKYIGTTWQIKFKLDQVDQAGTYIFRLALAAASLSELQVRVNDPKAARPIFSTGFIGRDNAIARHGIHGLYWLYNIDIRGGTLVVGDNTIYLSLAKSQSPFQGFMYDYIRLEAPAPQQQQLIE